MALWPARPRPTNMTFNVLWCTSATWCHSFKPRWKHHVDSNFLSCKGTILCFALRIYFSALSSSFEDSKNGVFFCESSPVPFNHSHRYIVAHLGCALPLAKASRNFRCARSPLPQRLSSEDVKICEEVKVLLLPSVFSCVFHKIYHLTDINWLYHSIDQLLAKHPWYWSLKDALQFWIALPLPYSQPAISRPRA